MGEALLDVSDLRLGRREPVGQLFGLEELNDVDLRGAEVEVEGAADNLGAGLLVGVGPVDDVVPVVGRDQDSQDGFLPGNAMRRSGR